MDSVWNLLFNRDLPLILPVRLFNLTHLLITVFLYWFGSFLETEIIFSKQHGETSKPLGNCSQLN